MISFRRKPTCAAALILLTIAAIAGCGGIATSLLEPSFPAPAVFKALAKVITPDNVPE
jgi:hypothetical protein